MVNAWRKHVKETYAALKRNSGGKVVLLKDALKRASKTYKKSKAAGPPVTRRKCKGESKKRRVKKCKVGGKKKKSCKK